MLLSITFDMDSVRLRAKLRSLASNGRDGQTGLLFSTAGLRISVISDSEAAPTEYTSAANLIETIATLGSYAAPTGGKCRFRELHATSHPGIYEFQFANSIYSVTGAMSLILSVQAPTIVECDYTIPLPKLDFYRSLYGKGADTVTITITSSGNPVPDANVWVTVDQAGASVVAGTARTDSAGNVKFLLDNGVVYYLWMQKDGINPKLGERFTAVADP